MSEGFATWRRRPRSSPLRTRRIGDATAALAVAGAPVAAFPGLPNMGAAGTREDVVSGAISTFVHGAILGLLILLAWLAPEKEELIPVQLIKEQIVEARPEPKAEPAPAPKALAERRAVDFAPQAQAIQPQVINPSVVARAQPVQAQKFDPTQIAPIAAPKQISQANVVVARATAIQSIASAHASAVDVQAVATPALRGPADAAAPSGPSAGPRQVVTTGSTVGTGTAVSLGDTSSVRDGIASTRDVLGSPDGAPLANVNTRVGQGFLRGDGGQGSGGGVESDCLSRPEVLSYTEQIRTRVYARWVVPPDVPRNQQVKLRFVLEPGGSLTKVEVLQASDRGLGTNAMEALRAAAPFPPMPERVRCLARHNLTGTWSVGDYREAGAGGD